MKTILPHSEQGYGDTIQFCRYVRLIAGLGARVILEVPAVLSTLLASLDGVAQITVPGEPLPPFDYHCPLLSWEGVLERVRNDLWRWAESHPARAGAV